MQNTAVVAGGAAAAAAFGACAVCMMRRQRDGDSDDEGFEAVQRGVAEPAQPPRQQSQAEQRVQQRMARLLERERREEEEEERRRLEEVERAANKPSVPASPEEAAPEREQSPKKPQHGCASPPGSIDRDERTLVPAVLPANRRPTASFPQPPPESDRLDVAAIHATPSEEEWNHRRHDATRWQWHDFTLVDSRRQLVSAQHQYVHDGTGVRFLLIPMLRLADAQFFDSVVDQCLAAQAFVLSEYLHDVDTHPRTVRVQQESAARDLETDSAELRQQVRRQTSGGQFDPTCNEVGGDCVLMQYFQTLLELLCRWELADPPLSAADMQSISREINCRETFESLCRKREQFLFTKIDAVLEAAADPDWRTPAGSRVIALPWNGRHCMRIERFLVQCRGLRPEPGVVDRILFDPLQTSAMVRAANKEEEQARARQLRERAERPVVDFASPRAQAQSAELPATDDEASPRSAQQHDAKAAAEQGAAAAAEPEQKSGIAE
eukprot:TRINITY_DN8180_c0_g1_i1.p1 TRINITY_DN8180_c0_g1~~TRINITY_DN8180_c0_g1_i1.p1  ORF type:complete len:495 (+),score=230.94 TRINITY_DN8180_c0_g1_i1:67-1551(+)